MAITQTITAIPKAGKRGIDTRDSFVTKQEAFQDALTDTFVTQINAFRTQANTLETNVNNKEASTIQSATTATTKASEASSSATSALASKNAAKTSETNASASEVLAGKWANENENVIVQGGKYSAKHYALKAEEFMNMSEAVKLTGNQTIAGVKTFTLSPIVPTPTTDYQVATKKYVDDKTSTFENIAQLKLNSNIGRVDVLGYYSKGDGGGGTFYWDSSSTETDNGGTIIQATGVNTGRWKRVYSGAVDVKWFGGDVIAMKNYGKESLGEGFSKFGDSKEGVWYRFGKYYELEGTVEKFELRPFLHDYRPTIADGADYNGDGGNIFIGAGAGNFEMKPDVNAIGEYMLHCSHNQGFGLQSLGKLTTGYKNVCYGTNTGRYLTEGYDNTANGRDAMHQLTTGQKNCFYGRSAGFSQVDGNFNSAFGSSSDQNRATGNGNTVLGAYSGREFVDGNYNTLVGYYNSKDQTTGSGNIGIGYQTLSGNGITTGNYNTVIGGNFQGLPNVNRQVVIGNGNGEKFIHIDPAGGNGSYVLLQSTNTAAYNPDALDGQSTAGATLALRATGGSNYNVAQIAFQSRNGQPWNRIVSTGGAAPKLNFITNNSEQMVLDSSGNLIQTINSSAPSLNKNQSMVFELTSDTQLKIKVRGSDGVTREATMALS